MSTPIIGFFGGEPLGVPALNALATANLTPKLIVCNPDRPAGRGQQLAAPPVKAWATEHGVKTVQPISYTDKTPLAQLTETDWDLFIVVAYNFILPQWVLQLPKHGVINLHPSLLPKLRGASPIRSAIKNDLKEVVGVSLMLMDEQLDHGPILKQQPLQLSAADWPIPGPDLDAQLAQLGGTLLAETVPEWLAGHITPQPQDHDHATYCKRFEKSDAEIALDPLALPSGEAARAALHHIYAFMGIGDSYFIYNHKRVKIKQAKLAPDGSLCLLRVTPAGKPEMDFTVYQQTLAH
jgi:methionyl-tRNA formyltransferase